MGPPGSRRRRLVFFAVCGPLLIGAIAVFREVLTPFVLAVLIAYVFAPVVRFLEGLSIGGRHLPRWVVVVMLYVSLLGAIATTVAIGAPRIAAEIQRLAGEAPAAIHTVQDEWVPRVEEALRDAGRLYGDSGAETPVEASHEATSAIRVEPDGEDGAYLIHLPEGGIDIEPQGEGGYRVVAAEAELRTSGRSLRATVVATVRNFFSDFEAYSGTALRGVQTFVGKLVGGVFSFFITLMLSAYILITSERIFGFFRSLAHPQRRERFDDLVARIDKGLAGVVRGQLLIALVNGVLSGIGFYVLGLSYWPVLTLVATVLSLIPIFGAIISSVPAVLIGLREGPLTAGLVLAWIVGIHQLEANLLNPKIMGDAAKVHPVLVVFALLAGEHLFGILGALIAVPLLSVTQSVFLHFREIALGVPKDPALAAAWADATLDRAAETPELDDSEE